MRDKLTMKTICPVCGEEECLQERGNSNRIQHYTKYHEGKRTFICHQMKTNGNNTLETKTLKLSFMNKLVADEEGFEPSTPNLGGWCSLRDCRLLQQPIRTELLALDYSLSYLSHN